MKKKKKVTVSSNFYSVEKVVYKRKRFCYTSNPKGYLYSKATIEVNVKKDDLPPCFVPIRYKKCFGYIRVNKVKDITYIERTDINHFIKDDVLLVSYDGPIIKDNESGDLFSYSGYELYVFGLDILTVLKGISIYSKEINTASVFTKIKNKKDFLLMNNYESYLLEASNIDLSIYKGETV